MKGVFEYRLDFGTSKEPIEKKLLNVDETTAEAMLKLLSKYGHVRC